jgi:hypothetical protein
LKITVSGSGTVAPFVGSKNYTPGTEVEVNAVPASGWEFDGWIGPDGQDVDNDLIVMDEDKHITAKFVRTIEPPVLPSEAPEIANIILDERVPLDSGELPDAGANLPIGNFLLGAGSILLGIFGSRKKK